MTTDKQNLYAVVEIFSSIQGEGYFSGRPAIFVRFAGCNLWSGINEKREQDAKHNQATCPRWCDTEFKTKQLYSLEQLLLAISKLRRQINFIVLTGGEPFLQIDGVLIHALRQAGFQIAVETNGSLPIEDRFVMSPSGGPDWITCSPKQPEELIRLEIIDELKLVIPYNDPDRYQSVISRVRMLLGGNRTMRPLFLQPEHSFFLNHKDQLLEWMYRFPEWRLSVQLHKICNVA